MAIALLFQDVINHLNKNTRRVTGQARQGPVGNCCARRTFSTPDAKLANNDENTVLIA